MIKKISFKGVIIGSVVDVVGTNIFGMFLGIGIAIHYGLTKLPPAEMANQLKVLIEQSSTVAIFGMLVGGLFTVLGGYIAARIAKRNELLNGTLASFLCVFFALLAVGSAPFGKVIIGVVVNPILGFIGGYLRLSQKRKKVGTSHS